ncbi:MAG TPA: hypothetical protein VFB67_03760 [Candidatus Polarisedimenticolaceae bacterium]|nr:hypothetical protein [Candidatus Polarisedimenticolaceae bacterium]
MSEYAPDGTPRRKDPYLRILGGCALVVGGCIVLVLVLVGIVGWRLTRDEAPGRAEEAFLVGDETRYWCLDLKPDDPGLRTLGRTFQDAADEARREAVRDSPFRMFIVGSRRDPTQEILPLRLELALRPETGWTGRATFGRATLRIRAALKIMRWMIARDRDSSTTDVDGVRATTLTDHSGLKVSFASVGNRVLVASDLEGLSGALRLPASGGGAPPRPVVALHEVARLEGEDGWAFGPGPSVASFDVTPEDELVVRVALAPGVPPPADAIAEIRKFLPRIPLEGLVVDPGAPKTGPAESTLIEGRIPGLADRLAHRLMRFSARPGRPSATPPPPSPPPSSDPRTDTPEGSTHGGTPTPGR